MTAWLDVKCDDCGHTIATVRSIPATRIDPPDHDGDIPTVCPECGADTSSAEWETADEPEIEYEPDDWRYEPDH